MVKFWELAINEAIKTTKRRITHMEKHGIGASAMEEKKILQKQLRQKELLNK